jgi:DUF2934 family protein
MKKNTAAQETAPQETAEFERKIRQRAFRIWVEEGHPRGKEREHWQRAKAEVIAAEPSFVETSVE